MILDFDWLIWKTRYLPFPLAGNREGAAKSTDEWKQRGDQDGDRPRFSRATRRLRLMARLFWMPRGTLNNQNGLNVATRTRKVEKNLILHLKLVQFNTSSGAMRNFAPETSYCGLISSWPDMKTEILPPLRAKNSRRLSSYSRGRVGVSMATL